MYGVLWGGVAGFLIGIYRAALFKVLIFCVVCAVGVILFAILAIVFGIAFVVARDIQRWRDQTEFLEDIMQVLGDKRNIRPHYIRRKISILWKN